MVATVDVRRLSSRAAIDESEVIRAKKSFQSTRVIMAPSGARMNAAPSRAGA